MLDKGFRMLRRSLDSRGRTHEPMMDSVDRVSTAMVRVGALLSSVEERIARSERLKNVSLRARENRFLLRAAGVRTRGQLLRLMRLPSRHEIDGLKERVSRLKELLAALELEVEISEVGEIPEAGEKCSRAPLS